MTAAAPSLETGNPWSWYAVVAGRDLAAGQILPAVLAGENLVVWRAQDGRPSAWSDRCPHRGMRLSLGATQGDALICPYHGWTFGPDGHCTFIPAHPKLQPSRAARARIYPIAEQGGYVWVCLGEPAASGPPTVADMMSVRTLHLPVEIDVAIAALLVCPLGPVAPGRSAVAWPTAAAPQRSSDGAVTARVTIDPEGRQVFTARLELPGQLSCTGDAPGGPIRYRVLLHPTEADACVVHLATEPGTAVVAKLALNRSLVRLRDDIGRLSRDPAVARARAAFGRAAPEPIHQDRIDPIEAVPTPRAPMDEMIRRHDAADL